MTHWLGLVWLSSLPPRVTRTKGENLRPDNFHHEIKLMMMMFHGCVTPNNGSTMLSIANPPTSRSQLRLCFRCFIQITVLPSRSLTLAPLSGADAAQKNLLIHSLKVFHHGRRAGEGEWEAWKIWKFKMFSTLGAWVEVSVGWALWKSLDSLSSRPFCILLVANTSIFTVGYARLGRMRNVFY